jgi:hypothetical protein
MGSKSAPTPDYAGAAQATAAGNLQAAKDATMANRVNQITPQGSLTYTAPKDDKNPWTVTQTYSPDQQNLYDQNNRLGSGLLGLAGSTLGQIGSDMSHPITAADLPANMVNAGESGQQAYMRMAQPDLAKAREMAETQAAQQGITRGSAAWDDMQRTLGVNENNASDHAITSGFGMGQQAQQQALQTQTALKANPINMISALRSGGQVSNPTFSSVPQQQTTTGADMLGAANMTGQANIANANASQAGINGLLGTAGQLGAAYLGSPAGSAAMASMF